MQNHSIAWDVLSDAKQQIIKWKLIAISMCIGAIICLFYPIYNALR